MTSIKHYKDNCLSRDIALKLATKNIMSCPKIDKISINISMKEALINSNRLLIPLILLKLITGQKPKITIAKRSVAQFKLRKGKALGAKVTLRGKQMYYFLEKFIYSILPQILEIRTQKLNSSLNYVNIGIEDISIFSELENQYEFLRNTQGLNIMIFSKQGISKKKKHNSNLLFSGLKVPV